MNRVWKCKVSWQVHRLQILVCSIFHCSCTNNKRTFVKTRIVFRPFQQLSQCLSIRIINKSGWQLLLQDLRRKWEMLVPIQLCNHFKSQFCRVGTRYIWSNIAAFNQEAIEIWVDVYYHRTATLLKLTTEVIVVLLCKLKPFRCVIKSRIISIIIFPGETCPYADPP